MNRLIPQLPNTGLSNHGPEIQTATELNFIITQNAYCLQRKMNDSNNGHTETSLMMKDEPGLLFGDSFRSIIHHKPCQRPLGLMLVGIAPSRDCNQDRCSSESR